ncbi:MAG: PAS domain S-box protein, partial [Candidatus Thermoplasmatota archaeon]|nr:PAS domain S-box protein [Candidatus Thermoplasmatota archaeon]
HNLVAKASARFLQVRDKKTFDKVIDQTLESFGNLFKVDRSYLFRVSKDLSAMDYTYEWCAPEITSQKHRIKQTSLEKFSWWKTQMVKLHPILIPDVAKLPDEASVEKKELHYQGIQSLISLPICDDRKQLIGFLGFDSVMEKKSWSEKQVNMLQVLAEIIGNAIVRIETTIALSESEERYHMLFDQSQDAIMTLEPPLWKFTSGNPTTIKMFGTNSVDEFISLSPWDVSPEYQPDGQLSKEKAKEMIETAMRTGSHYFDWTHMRLDKTTFQATVLLSKVQIKKETYLLAVVRDITEKKQAEDALRESEEKFRQISENMGEVFWLRNADNTKMLYVNPAYEKVWGHSCESLYENPQSFIDTIFDDDKPAVFAEFERYIHSGKFNIEYRIVRADGDIRWIHARSFPIMDKKGTIIRHTGLAVDVTKQKQLEHELRLSKQHLEKRVKERTQNLQDTLNQLKETEKKLREVYTYLKNVIDSASEFIFTLDDEYRITMWNKTVENITGKTSAQLIGKKIKNVPNIMNPQLLIDCLKNTALGYNTYETNLIVKSKNGKLFTFDISCSIIEETGNKNKGYIIFGKNVTQARRINEKLVWGSSYIQYKKTILNDETFLVDIQSQNNSILLITRESSQITEEIVKLDIDILYLDDNTTDNTHIYSCEQVFSKISTYCNTHDSSVIIINRLDYLIMNNSFETVLKLIYRINSLVARINAVLIIQVNSDMFSKNQLKLLEEELQLLKGFEVEDFSLEEPLYKLLRFIYEQNQKNVAVPYGAIGKHFDISKVTTGKRILELEQKGLVSISIKGRMKTIHTTIKGEELLISHKKT